MADATIVIGGNTSEAVAALEAADGSVSKLGDTLGKVALASGAAFAGITGAIGIAVNEFKEAELVQGKLAATLQSTGFSAGLTSKEVIGLANEIQKSTTFSDEAVVSSSNLLLTMDKIGKEVFPRAQKAIVDVAAGMKIDLQTATIQVGKALNDPIEGLAGLSRMGIRFNDTQKKLIAGFVQTGETAKAQEVILQEVEKRFLGQAAAATQGLGAIDQLRNAFSDLLEVLGAEFAPLVSQAAVAVKTLVLAISENQEIIRTTAAFLGLSAAFSGLLFGASSVPLLITKLGALNIALTGTTTVVRGLVGATGLGLLVLALSYVVTHMAEVENATRSTMFAIFGVISEIASQIGNVFSNLREIMVGAFTFDGAQIKAGLAGIGDAVRAVTTRAAAEWRAGKEITKQIISNQNAEISKEELRHLDELEDMRRSNIARDAEARTQANAAEAQAQQNRADDLIASEREYADTIFDIDSDLGDRQVSDYDATTDDLRSAADRRRSALAERSSDSGSSSGSGSSKDISSPLIGKGLVSSGGNVLFDDSDAGRKARAQIGPGQFNPFTGGRDLKEYLMRAFNAAGVRFEKGFSGYGSENLVARFSGKEVVIPETFAEGLRAGRYALTGPGGSVGGRSSVEISFKSREAAKVLTASTTASRRLGTFRGSQ